jgi:hypothetical protein
VHHCGLAGVGVSWWCWLRGPPRRDVDDLWNTIKPPNPTGDGRDRNGQDWSTAVHPAADGEWDHRVRQWGRDWVQYDQYYRPVICNPYHDALRVVYLYQGAPRTVVIEPLASVVMEVADYGAFNFTGGCTSTLSARP